MQTLTQDNLKEFLTYNPMTGVFTWVKKPSHIVRIGQKAGAVNSAGYICIRISGTTYQAHQLAYLYMLGELKKNLDHINGDRTDNRWENLREATLNSNAWNRKIYKTNSTGVKGVYWNESNKGFTASVQKDKKRYSATFQTLEEAEDWAKALRNSLHKEFANHG